MDTLEASLDEAPPAKKARLEESVSMPLPSLQDDLEDVYGEDVTSAHGESSAVIIAEPDEATSLPLASEAEGEPFCLPGLGLAPDPDPPIKDMSKSSEAPQELSKPAIPSGLVELKPREIETPPVEQDRESTVKVSQTQATTPLKHAEAPPTSLEADDSLHVISTESEHLSQGATTQKDRTSGTMFPEASNGPAAHDGTSPSDGLANPSLREVLGPSTEPARAQNGEAEQKEREAVNLQAPVAGPSASSVTALITNDRNGSMLRSSIPDTSKSVAQGAASENGAIEVPRPTAVDPQELDLEAVLNQISGAGQDGSKAQEPASPPPDSGEAEFEIDSSPYVSSEDSSDSSSEDDSDDADDYQLLDPAETARWLMEDDGASDGEGPKKGNTGPLKTANEVVDESIEIPNVEITADMEICELGSVEATVNNSVLIKAQTSGEYRVLDSGSLLCLESRQVIGIVAETLGRVQQPLYCVRFPSKQKMVEFGIDTGVVVYYVPQHSIFVFTKSLQGVKGSDASNLHDEEVREDEIEFSDDEAEAAYKRAKKQERLSRKGVVPEQRNGSSRGGRFSGRGNRHAGETPLPSANGSATLDYDENDEPYTRLARPANLHQMQDPASREFPEERIEDGQRNMRGHRGRGRGARGGHARRGQWTGQQLNSPGRPSQPDRSRPRPHELPSPQTFQTPTAVSSPYASTYTDSPRAQQAYQGYYPQATQSPAFSQSSMPSPGYGAYPSQGTPTSLQQYFQGLGRQYEQASNGSYPWPQQAPAPIASPGNPPHPGTPGAPAIPPGAYVNPAFFPQQYQQQQQHGYSANHQQNQGSQRQ